MVTLPYGFLQDWYQALFEEDCEQIVGLLKKFPEVLTEGWKSNPSRKVRWRQDFWTDETESLWMGRTALHVGARRGCVKLVEQVIQLCEGHQGAQGRSEEDHSESISSRANNQSSTIPSHSDVEWWGDDGNGTVSHSHADAPNQLETTEATIHVVGNVSPGRNFERIKDNSTTGVQRGGDDGSGNTSHSHSDAPDQLETAQATIQVAEKNPDRNSGRTEDSSTQSLAFANYKSKLTKVRSRAQERAEVWVSLKDLSLVKDGQYNLDALAIAALHANPDILSLLIRKTRYSGSKTSDDSSHVKDSGGHSSQLHYSDGHSSQLHDSDGHSSQLYDSSGHSSQLHHSDGHSSQLYDSSGHSSQLHHSDNNTQLRSITERVIESVLADPFSSTSCRVVLDAYGKHRDFNFLPKGKYFFHFLFTGYFQTVTNEATSTQAQLIREYLWDEVNRCSQSLWNFLLKLQDGQGRTPLHVAVDEGTVETFFDLLNEGGSKEEALSCAMTTTDAAGRTALHRAVAKGNLDAIRAMRDSMSKAEFKDLFQAQWQHPLQFIRLDVKDTTVDELSMRNGFQGRRFWDRIQWAYEYLSLETSTPLHSALIHKRTQLLDDLEIEIFSPQHVSFPWIPGDNDMRLMFLDLLELATLMGEVSTVRRLITVALWQEVFQQRINNGVGTQYGWLVGGNQNLVNNHAHQCSWPTIHIAANYGNYELLKAFIECPNGLCDPYIEDFEKNTVLHHAMKVRKIKFEAHLLDYVDCEHICSNDPRLVIESSIIERQGCIELLLQSGCDIFKANQGEQLPYPRCDLSTNASFLSWWYEKQSKEFKVIQNTMSFATNAISVTATLVATASYVGPLQPPLGYEGSPPTQIEIENIWVKFFIICDTLSFYLAIASITFSLIPSLPMPQQPVMEELKRIRRMITLAVATLFPSIICILMAFASSSIAVVSENSPSSFGGNLTIITSSIGGLICFGGFFLLFTRLLGIIFPRSTWVRKVYNLISF